jgi:hypothetical protein
MLKAGRGGGGGYKSLRCHNFLAQRRMKLDDFNHELPSASDAGLHVYRLSSSRRQRLSAMPRVGGGIPTK